MGRGTFVVPLFAVSNDAEVCVERVYYYFFILSYICVHICVELTMGALSLGVMVVKAVVVVVRREGMVLGTLKCFLSILSIHAYVCV